MLCINPPQESIVNSMRYSTVHNEDIKHDLQLILTNKGKECAVCSSRGLQGRKIV